MQRVASSWNVKEEQHNSQDGKLQTSSSSSSSSSPSPTPPSPSLATITTSSPVHMIGARKHLVNYVMHTKSPVAIESFEKSEFYDPLQSLLIGSVLCVPIELKVFIFIFFICYHLTLCTGKSMWSCIFGAQRANGVTGRSFGSNESVVQSIVYLHRKC